MKIIQRGLLSAIFVVSAAALMMAQPPAGGPGGGKGAPGGGKGGGKGGPPRIVFTVTSPSFPDGGEVPMKHAGVGENKLPAFEFHWVTGTTEAMPPDTLKTYAVVFHDI